MNPKNSYEEGYEAGYQDGLSDGKDEAWYESGEKECEDLKNEYSDLIQQILDNWVEKVDLRVTKNQELAKELYFALGFSVPNFKPAEETN